MEKKEKNNIDRKHLINDAVKVKANKNKDNLYEVTFVMDENTLLNRLAMINEKIIGIEKSIKLYGEQLELLKQEKKEIELSLNIKST